MSKIKVIAGDIETGVWVVPHDIFGRQLMRKELSSTKINLKQELERIELQTEESVKKLAGTAGWGLTGLALFGPLGAIGGMLIGGRGKKVCFAAYLKDGRKFLATTDGKTFQKISAATF